MAGTGSEEKEYYVYIVECSDRSLYTGCTTDIKRRITEHNNGVASKYTRGRTPVVLKYRERCGDRSKAQQREYEIKQLTRKQKEQLIRDN